MHRVAERRDDPHREHEQGECHDGIGDTADDTVGPTAEETGSHAGEPAYQKDQGDRKDGDDEIELGRRDDPAENIAAQLVSAEQMRDRWRL